ncbi:helix-turn-helix domain-containing protein [Promicromonospora panici]|uniref:nSTAND1 domain-containing NTPase n=1 Tax=Promicromonospora panici TaxID=2219658 RepID=UPI00101C3153|nr:helix-turn-helix domain-containing protein [Promicromonospora panici]
MGRREKPVDPGAGPVQRLAHDLRALREQAGTPTYREMARRTDYSPSALSQAAAGEVLPSLAVVLAYASALDADPAEWERRWRDADRDVREAAARDEDTAPPYRGLARFEPGDRELFFGRDELVGELLELVREHRFAAVFGPSGSGKSSLLRAGLIPALSKIPAIDRPGLIRILTPGERPAHTHADALVPQDGEQDTWVIVDQFEELFTLCRDRAERNSFLDALLTAREPASRLRVVIAVRGDFYGHCATRRDLADAVRRANLLVGPMSPAELREVITGPATAVGLNVERALTARIIDETTDRPGALPMLSHTLLETWRHRRGRTLTLAAYEETGGVEGAIAATAEKLYADLSPAQARTARRVLLRLIAPGDGTADTRRPAERAELDAGTEMGSAGSDAPGHDVDVVIERLATARLITLGEGVVELAHEALITGWPRLRDWIDQDRERLREQRRLGEAARAWEELDRDPGALYRGTRLERAAELFGGTGGGAQREDDLTRPERAFLTAALAARDAEQGEAIRTTRRFRTLAAALSAFLVLALGAGLLAWQENRASEEEHTRTTARRIAAVAGGLRAADPRAAALLGVAAWQIAPLTESRSALLGSLAQPEVDAFTDRQTGTGTRRFLAADGQTLFSSADRRVRVWDVVRGEQTDGFQLPAGTTLDGVSPDARTLYVSGPDGAELWDVATRRPVAARMTEDIALADFAADGRSYLVSSLPDGHGEGFVQRRRTEDGKVLFERDVAGDVSQAGLGADGRLVAMCPIGGTLQVWDSVSGERRTGAWGTEEVCGIASGSIRFSRDGTRLAMASAAETRVWDLTSGRLLAEVMGSGDGLLPRTEFSPDGAFLALADDTALTVWRLRDSGVLVFQRALDGEVAGNLAWSPGERPVLRFLAGSTVRSYGLGARLAPWQATPTDTAALSPDGTALAIAAHSRKGGGYRFELRSPGTGEVLATADLGPLQGADGDTPLLVFSPDGRALVVADTTTSRGSVRQRFTVWDVRRHEVRTSFDIPLADEHPLSAITLGPQGRTLLVSRLDDAAVVDVWDTGTEDGEAGPRRTGTLPVAVGALSAVRPDGRLLADSADQATTLPSGTVAGRALAQGREVTALAFSPDGTVLAVGDSAGRVHLWDGDVEQRAGFLAGLSGTGEVGVREAVSAIAFSADGRTLALGGTAGTLQLWDTASQQLLAAELPTAGEEIRSLAFSRDGGTVYAASPHAPLQTYSIDPDRAVLDICDRTGTGLTRDQWRTYVPDAPYRQVCAQKRD